MINVLLADDHAVVRQGLRHILTNAPEIRCSDEATTGTEALEKIRTGAYDVVILDITMPGLSGLEVLSRILVERPGLPVLVMSMHPEKEFAVRVLKAGGAGYLTKDAAPRQLVDAVHTVARGEQYITHHVGQILASRLKRELEKKPHEGLSAREFDVLCRIARGESQREIADALAVSPKTVSTFRARILQKLQLRNDADLARYAFQHHLVE